MANGLPQLPPLPNLRSGEDSPPSASGGKRARSASDSGDANGRPATRARLAASDTGEPPATATASLPPASSDRSLVRQSSTSLQGAIAALSTAATPSASQGSVHPKEPSFAEDNLLKLGGKSFLDIPQFTHPSKGPSPHTLRHTIGANITLLADQIVDLQESARARDADVAGLTDVLHGDDGPKDDLRRLRKDIDNLHAKVNILGNADPSMLSDGTDFVSLAAFNSLYDHYSQLAAGVVPVVERSHGIEKELKDLAAAVESLRGQSRASVITAPASLPTTAGTNGTPGPFGQTFSAYAAVRDPFQDPWLSGAAYSSPSAVPPAGAGGVPAPLSAPPTHVGGGGGNAS
ncbi:hypothetical protein K525DRAFT_275381, partial [Schizophyllum commune Loenen D]